MCVCDGQIVHAIMARDAPFYSLNVEGQKAHIVLSRNVIMQQLRCRMKSFGFEKPLNPICSLSREFSSFQPARYSGLVNIPKLCSDFYYGDAIFPSKKVFFLLRGEPLPPHSTTDSQPAHCMALNFTGWFFCKLCCG